MPRTNSPKTARRNGIVHIFEDAGARAAWLTAHKQGVNVPLILRDGPRGRILGRGALSAAYLKGNDLLGTITWPLEIEQAIGDATPVARPKFSADGSIESITMELDDEDEDSDEDEEDEEDNEYDEDDEDDDELISRLAPPPQPRSKAAKMPSKYKVSLDDDDTNDDDDGGIEAAFDKLVGQYGNDPRELSLALIKSLSMAQGRAAKAETRLKEIEPNIVPADHVAIPKADADALQAYRDINPDPVAVKARVDQANEIGTKLAQRERSEYLDTIAAARGITGSGVKVFKSLVRDGMEFEIKDEVDPRTRKEAKRVYVKLDKDGKKTTMPMEDLEKGDEWAPFVPSLYADSGVRRDEVKEGSFTGYRGGNPAQRSVTPPLSGGPPQKLSAEEETRQYLLSVGARGI